MSREIKSVSLTNDSQLGGKSLSINGSDLDKISADKSDGCYEF